MESKNTFILHETEAFMRGELDNVTVAHGRIVLDLVSGGHVPYGCYTSPAVPLPTFDALRVSWNAGTPPGTAVEAQARVMVDGNWTSWSSFGRWSPYLEREGAAPVTKGAVNLLPDSLVLDSKTATQAQLRIYLYTKDEHTTPSVSLVGVSVRAVDVIPAGGRPINARLHLMPYAVARRAPALQPVMDLAICLASLTNRWGADILPEEFALAMRDCRSTDAERNLSFAAAAAGCWGFPCWACWGNLALLRSEVRAGYGVIVGLESTSAQQAAGMPPLRYAALRGFRQGAQPAALLVDPYAAAEDFDTETELLLDDFLVAWNNTALCMRKRDPDGALPGCPVRTSAWLRRVPKVAPDLFAMYIGSTQHVLPDDFCAALPAPAAPAAPEEAPAEDAAPTDAPDAPDSPAEIPVPQETASQAAPVHGGILAWSTLDEHPHATTAHRQFHYVTPEQGCIRLAVPPPPGTRAEPRKYTVYAIEPSGSMLVGDVMI